MIVDNFLRLPIDILYARVDYAGMADTDTIQRYRCANCRRLYAAESLINPRPSADQPWRNDFIEADGQCVKCGTGWNAYPRGGHGHFGPAANTMTLNVVGVKIVRMDNIKCGGRCFEAVSLECKCSCGGEHHGIGAG